MGNSCCGDRPSQQSNLSTIDRPKDLPKLTEDLLKLQAELPEHSKKTTATKSHLDPLAKELSLVTNTMLRHENESIDLKQRLLGIHQAARRLALRGFLEGEGRGKGLKVTYLGLERARGR